MIGIIKVKSMQHKAGTILDLRGRERHYHGDLRDPSCNHRGTIVSFRDDISDNIAREARVSGYVATHEIDRLLTLLNR